MCLAIPLRVSEINGKDAIGEVEGVKRAIRVDFIPDVKIGDYVIVHAGFAIERLDPERAKDNIAAFMEVINASR